MRSTNDSIGVMASRQSSALRALSFVLFVISVSVSAYSSARAEQLTNQDQGVFLVATEQLQGSSFQETVILLTHNSERGATGLTINRPTDITLQQAFPRIRQLQQRSDPLYLGGPVGTNAIFVLVRTKHPHRTMHRIANDIYFSTGQNAFDRPLEPTSRTYAGYVGWAPGQLQAEISRGDWLIVHTEPEIIFEENTSKLWQHLIKRWSGLWL